MAIKTISYGKYKVDLRDNRGKRIQRTFKRLTDAKAFEAENYKTRYEHQLIKNGLKDERYPILKALDEFELTKVNLRPKTIQKYKYNIGLLRKTFEVFKLDYVDEFSQDHATKLYSELVREKLVERGVNKGKIARAKPKTINFFLNTARSFFQLELIKGHINRNPFLAVKNLRVEKKRPDYYSVAELKSFFSQEMPEQYRNVFLGFLFTGMRFSELANLTWNDIDFDRRLIYIRPKESFKTKTYNSERSIPINDFLFELLKKIAQFPTSDIYPFCSRRGTKIRERRTLEICKKIAEKAKIKSAYLHKFRSTTASMLVQNGVSIHSVKELLGHSSVTQTELYAHHNPKLLHPEVAVLNNILK